MKKKMCCILAVILILTGLVGCASAERKLVMNDCGVAISSAIRLMKLNGVLEKYLPEDVTLEWTNIATGPDIRDAILAGSVSIGDPALMNTILAIENDVPMVLLSMEGYTPISVYSNREEITSLADFLTDNRLSLTNRATTLHAAVMAKVFEEGWDTTAMDQNLVPMPNAEALAALLSGTDIAGSTFSFPAMCKAQAEESVHEVCNLNDVIREYSIGSALVTSQQYYEQNRDICDAVLQAQKEVLQLLADDTEGCAELLAPEYNVTKEQMLWFFEEMMPSDQITGYDKQAQLLYQIGMIDHEPKPFTELVNYENIPQ